MRSIDQPDRTLTADKGTMLFEPDNTVQHVVAEGNVHIQSRGPSVVDITGPRGDLNMGPNNTVQQAILSGGAKFDTHGASVAHGSADTFVLDFDDQNQPCALPHGEERAHDAGPAAGQAGAGQPAASRWKLPPTSSISCWRMATSSRPATPSARRTITIFPAAGPAKPASRQQRAG